MFYSIVTYSLRTVSTLKKKTRVNLSYKSITHYDVSCHDVMTTFRVELITKNELLGRVGKPILQFPNWL